MIACACGGIGELALLKILLAAGAAILGALGFKRFQKTKKEA